MNVSAATKNFESLRVDFTLSIEAMAWYVVVFWWLAAAEPPLRPFSNDCCGSCDGKPFCSPISGNCYDEKGKHYYLACAAPGSTTPPTAGVARCDPLTVLMAAFVTQTSAECQSRCRSTVGCNVYAWKSPTSACGGNGHCWLLMDWCSVNDPCWEQYRLDRLTLPASKPAEFWSGWAGAPS